MEARAGSGGEQVAPGGVVVPRRQDAEGAVRLLWIDFGREVVGPGAVLELFQGFGINVGFGDVQLQVQAFFQGVGAFHHDVEGLDAVDGDVALREDLGAGVVEVHADKNVELIGQDVLPSPMWLRRCSLTLGSCDAAVEPRVAAPLQPHQE